MENNGNKYNCGRSDDILAYIYNEIESSERRNFETHLAGCTNCTDEFAAVSDARFSVFEWHKEEFAHLPTPEISIPYAVKAEAPRFWAAIGERIRYAGWLVPAAAAIVFCVGIGFVTLILLRSNEADVARVEVKRPLSEAGGVDRGTETPTVISEVDKTDVPDAGTTQGVSGNKIVPSVERVVVRRVLEKSKKPRTIRTPSPTMGRLPVLSNYEENEDRSLRLSDLLDEVGG